MSKVLLFQNKYDVYGQLIKKTEDKKTTTYSYDVYGNTLSETDTYGNTKTSEYDKLDRLVKETDELGNVTQHKYDAMDNETETIDAKGNSERKIMTSTVFWFRILINLEILQLINTMTRVNKSKRLMPIKIQRNLNMTSLVM